MSVIAYPEQKPSHVSLGLRKWRAVIGSVKSVLQILFSIEPRSCPLSVSGGVQLYKREAERDKNIADIPFFDASPPAPNSSAKNTRRSYAILYLATTYCRNFVMRGSPNKR